MKKYLIVLSLIFIPFFAKAEVPANTFFFNDGKGYDISGTQKYFCFTDSNCYDLAGVFAFKRDTSSNLSQLEQNYLNQQKADLEKLQADKALKDAQINADLAHQQALIADKAKNDRLLEYNSRCITELNQMKNDLNTTQQYINNQTILINQTYVSTNMVRDIQLKQLANTSGVKVTQLTSDIQGREFDCSINYKDIGK